MNKKGFTLIELLGVVTLIALISIIAIPKITNNFLNKKNEISEANQKLLAAATDTYIENNKGIYNNSYEANGSTYCIPVQTLIDKGILEKPFKNINGKEIDYTNKIKATYQAEYNSFDYELVDSCEELIQYVSRPQLEENMIPVIYNEETSSWVKADDKSHWYNYSEKNWANAVVVNEYKSTEQNSKSRYEYVNAPAGTPILESDILGYFVWIPRFRYQLFESSSEKEINIVFESVATPKSAGISKNQWLTHPAFTYNNQELSGIWIGKYEASNQNQSPIIKSNQILWTNIGYNEARKIANSMTYNGNIYGLKKINTHLMRNSEWGAVAYLTNSKYGNNQNNSTTGNITGIYGLSDKKEFVTIDNENENSLGYALNETNNWIESTNTYISQESAFLTRGNNSIYDYTATTVNDSTTYFRISLINNEQYSIETIPQLTYYYININTNSKYTRLVDALSEVKAGEKIKLLENKTETDTLILPTGTPEKPVTLDLNGKTLTTTQSFINNGALLINGNGTLTSSKSAILTYGDLIVSDVTINSSARGIQLEGTEPKTLTVNAGTVITATNTAIWINSTSGSNVVIINGGNLTGAQGIYNYPSDSNITINDAIINCVYDDITNATTQALRVGPGVATINGGTLNGIRYGASVTTGTLTINGGKLNSSNGEGATVNGTGGKLYIGKKDGIVNSNPIITGSTYGVRLREGYLYFYDGTAIGTSGKSITTPTEIEPNYTITKTIQNNIETAILSPL